jgi:hypothetical protein
MPVRHDPAMANLKPLKAIDLPLIGLVPPRLRICGALTFVVLRQRPARNALLGRDDVATRQQRGWNAHQIATRSARGIRAVHARGGRYVPMLVGLCNGIEGAEVRSEVWP